MIIEQVKFSEFTIDTFRMLQCLEWEPSGSFYQSGGSKLSQNGATGTGRISYIQDIADPTLPANPRKAILYRPSLTHFIAVSMEIYIILFCFSMDPVVLVSNQLIPFNDRGSAIWSQRKKRIFH